MQRRTETNPGHSKFTEPQTDEQTQPVLNENIRMLSAVSGSEILDANTQGEVLSSSYQLS